MKIREKILSAMTAGICAFSVLSGTAPLTLSAFAADTEYTFDKLHDLTDTLTYSDFYTENNLEVKDKLKEVFKKACGKDFDAITYGDLLKITSLNLSKMELTDIPQCIKYMENLRTLDLSQNNLQNKNNVLTLNLNSLKKLNSLNVSWNYLSKVPSWYVLDGITRKYIDHNLLAGDDQRAIKAQTPVYYFMDGEKIEVDEFKERILADIRFDDGTELPEFLYDSTGDAEDQYLQITEFGLDGELDSNGYVSISESYKSVNVTVKLIDDPNNANTNNNSNTNSTNNSNTENTNTKIEIKIYLLDGSTPSTVKARLETLLDEVKELKKELYTSGSWTNFENAQKIATSIFGYQNADTEMLKTALEQLDAAKSSMILGVDADTKKVLADLTSVGKTYKEENFTPASWDSLQNALSKIDLITKDTNATLASAKTAILMFQNAQKGLESTKLDVPDVIPKSSFEGIFGEKGKSVSASGTTRSGRKYSWKFAGTDITAPADFKPEISDTPAGENAIMLESGRAGGYLAFSTVQSGKFAGKATLTINVSDKFDDGTYYFYKWNSSGVFIDDVPVKKGNLTVEISEGGTYYLSTFLQKFELVSDKLKINSQNHTIKIPLGEDCNAANFKKLFKYGSSVFVYDADGNSVSSTARVKTGMKTCSPNGAEYTITVLGDADNDGKVDLSDALEIIQYFLSDKESTAQKDAADANEDGSIDLIDALLVVQAFLK